jgi:hypothetical protein
VNGLGKEKKKQQPSCAGRETVFRYHTNLTLKKKKINKKSKGGGVSPGIERGYIVFPSHRLFIGRTTTV